MSYGVAAPEYRLPAATRLGAVHLQVSDLEQSIDYYKSVLGLTVQARDSLSASLSPHGTGPTLLRLRSSPGTHAAPRGGRLGLYHFALVVPDRPSLGRFVSHLSAADVPIASADHAVSEAIYLWDPDGLGIEVYVDRPRSAWRTQGAELFMTTDRLDLRSLMAAGAGALWGGMPEGTMLGHMHLHVGDLVQAEAFYHRTLGLDKTVWSYPGALFLSAGGYHHHLGTNTWAAGATQPAHDEARLLEWEILLPTAVDVEAAADSCAASGHAVISDGTSRVVADPWNTMLRLREGLTS